MGGILPVFREIENKDETTEIFFFEDEKEELIQILFECDNEIKIKNFNLPTWTPQRGKETFSLFTLSFYSQDIPLMNVEKRVVEYTIEKWECKCSLPLSRKWINSILHYEKKEFDLLHFLRLNIERKYFEEINAIENLLSFFNENEGEFSPLSLNFIVARHILYENTLLLKRNELRRVNLRKIEMIKF